MANMIIVQLWVTLQVGKDNNYDFLRAPLEHIKEKRYVTI